MRTDDPVERIDTKIRRGSASPDTSVTTERWDAIDAHAEAAFAIAGELGSPVWMARVQADWAYALDRRGRPGDRERALDLRARALPVAKRLGMPGLIARCSTPDRHPVESTPTKTEGGFQHRDSVRDDRVEFAQQGELWAVSGFGERIHVKDSRGMQMVARVLVDRLGREVPCESVLTADDGSLRHGLRDARQTDGDAVSI